MGGDQGHVAIRLDPNPSRRQTILWPSIFKLRTSRRALCVATLSLQREHRRRLRVFGRVLDVIDADCLTSPAHATKVPSGCSRTSVGPAVVVASFPDEEPATNSVGHRGFRPCL